MDSLNEVVIPKYDKNNEDIKVSTVQSLPFNSEFSGQVPINSYFITHEEDEEANSDKSLVGYFRGRELKGRDYLLPDDTRGLKFKTLSFNIFYFIIHIFRGNNK